MLRSTSSEARRSVRVARPGLSLRLNRACVAAVSSSVSSSADAGSCQAADALQAAPSKVLPRVDTPVRYVGRTARLLEGVR